MKYSAEAAGGGVMRWPDTKRQPRHVIKGKEQVTKHSQSTIPWMLK